MILCGQIGDFGSRALTTVGGLPLSIIIIIIICIIIVRFWWSLRLSGCIGLWRGSILGLVPITSWQGRLLAWLIRPLILLGRLIRPLILLRLLWRLVRVASPVLTLPGSSFLLRIVWLRLIESTLRLLSRRLPSALIRTLSPELVGKVIQWLASASAVSVSVSFLLLSLILPVELSSRSSSRGVSTTIVRPLYLEDIVHSPRIH